MATVDVGPVTLDYVERGAGPPVVLVHGSSSDRRTWEPQLGPLGEGHRVIAYSRRYHWPNEPIPDGADYSMMEHVADLEGFLRALDVGPVHLVGHSYGGFVTLLLAIRAPGTIRSLVLAEPPVLTLFASNEPRPSELLGLLVSRPRTAIAIISFAARGWAPATRAARRGNLEEAGRIFGRAVLGPDVYRELPDARKAQMRDNLFKAEFLGSGFPPLEDGDVRAVDLPVLLLDGERSPRFFRRLVDRLEELLPRAERAEIPGVSHLMHEADPGAYNAAVSAFLERHGPQDGAAS